jgi:hypothetical protein
MKRLLYTAANVLGAIVLALLAIDPTRDLTPIFALLAVAVALAWVPRYLR